MSRRTSNLNLPTAKGGAPTAVPQLLSVETNLSTDSTDSQGSVRTQVPGSYHQQHQHQQTSQALQAIQEEQWYGQIDNGALPFATPDLNNSATFMSAVPAPPGAAAVAGSSSTRKGLNPNSLPFAPPSSVNGEGYASPSVGYAAVGGVGVAQRPGPSYGGQVNNGYSTQIRSAASGGYGNYVPPQQKQVSDYGVGVQNPHGGYDRRGSMGGYQSQNGGYSTPGVYGQGNGAVQYPGGNPYGPVQNGGLPAYNGAAVHNSYGQYGQAAPMTGYGYQGHGQTNNGYTNTGNYGVANPNHTYQNSQYGSGNGYHLPGQAYGGQYQTHNQYAVQPPFIQQSNINRGKSTYHGSAKPNPGAPPYNPSKLATAPVVNASSQSRHPEVESQDVQNGGPVQPPSRAPSRVNSTSPTKSKASTVNSSADPSSSLPSGSTEEKNLGPGSPTPGPRRPQEFSSEPRNSRTPTLRSRRGQTLVPSTDPSSKQAMVNWLENVFPTPPPKMLSLELSTDSKVSGGDILAQAGVTLPSAASAGHNLHNDADPFTSTALQRVTPIKPGLNPFAPLPQHLVPYTGGGLLQKPPVSAPLRRLTANGKPAISDALEPVNLPMVEYCRLAREDTWGVIKIKNIPYSVNRPEVLAFLGRNARIINEQDFEPVHIVMERVTSKTLDCYVEFISFTEAVNAVNRFETNRTGGRGGRLGQRHVEVELSCQEQLMHDLFPKAKNVTWSGSRPIIKPRDPTDQYNSGFQGFISKEELVMLVKHVEAPQRSPFSKDCPQRPFECLISTLLKYPWYMVDYITIDDRNELHKVTLQLIDLLQERINGEQENINLTPMLLKRVWRAALKCPGFSPSQKDDICWKCGIDDQLASEMGVPSYPAFWKDLWTIGPKTGAPNDLILYYAALIRETIGAKPELTLAQKAAKGHQSAPPSLFGELVKLVDLPRDPKEFAALTLAQVASAEWAAIEQALRRALTPALTAGPSA